MIKDFCFDLDGTQTISFNHLEILPRDGQSHQGLPHGGQRNLWWCSQKRKANGKAEEKQIWGLGIRSSLSLWWYNSFKIGNTIYLLPLEFLQPQQWKNTVGRYRTLLPMFLLFYQNSPDDVFHDRINFISYHLQDYMFNTLYGNH